MNKSTRWWFRLYVASVVVTWACVIFAGWAIGSFIATNNDRYLVGAAWQVFVGWWCRDTAKQAHRNWRQARARERVSYWVRDQGFGH